MAHYAKIEKNIVTQVIRADSKFISKMPGKWKRTSYNMRGGVHSKGKKPLRLNFAGVGYIYNSVLDGFLPPMPFKSWILNNNEGLWYPPVKMPLKGDKPYTWNEKELKWDF